MSTSVTIGHAYYFFSIALLFIYRGIVQFACVRVLFIINQKIVLFLLTLILVMILLVFNIFASDFSVIFPVISQYIISIYLHR